MLQLKIKDRIYNIRVKLMTCGVNIPLVFKNMLYEYNLVRSHFLNTRILLYNHNYHGILICIA